MRKHIFTLNKASGSGAVNLANMDAAGNNISGNTSGSTSGSTSNGPANSATADAIGGAAVGAMSSAFGINMGEGPYAFKTLWQEITKGITAITNGATAAAINRSNNSAANFQTYWNKADSRIEGRDYNIGFYILLGLILTIGMIVFIVKNKKSK